MFGKVDEWGGLELNRANLKHGLVSGPRNLLSLSEAVLTWLDDGDPP